MYEDYFGLERPPFKITPDTSLFYEGGKRGDILAALVYAIQRGEGIVKVVGEVGSGKTMLCRMLQLELPKSVEIVYIANPSVSPEDILFVIAHELSLQVTRESSKHEVMHLLQDYLLQRHMENKQVVLFIEEAQGMPIETLEEIRLLSNLETDQHKLLQIILFGQPELDDNLAQKSIRQLRERITHNFRLEPLTLDEIHNYLNFRMREVGYTGPELINRNLAKKVEQYSGGLLRRINIIADKILLSAFAEGTHDLNSKHVTAAVDDSGFDHETPRRGNALWWLLSIILLALLFALYQSRPQWFSLQSLGFGNSAENAAYIDKPVTDITAQAGQTPADTSDVASVDSGDQDVDSVMTAGESSGGTAEASPEVLQKTAPESFAKAESGQKTGGNLQSAMTAEQVTDMNQSTATSELYTEHPESDSIALQANAAHSKEVVRQEAVVSRVDTNSEVDAEPRKAGSNIVALADSTPASESGKVAKSPSDLTDYYDRWLNAKLQESRNWLIQADSNNVSIQVFVRRKSAARQLVYYLLNEWPLDISKTYLYEVEVNNRSVYRVFYNEFGSMTEGRQQLTKLPDTVKVNSPYLHSVYRMQKALL